MRLSVMIVSSEHRSCLQAKHVLSGGSRPQGPARAGHVTSACSSWTQALLVNAFCQFRLWSNDENYLVKTYRITIYISLCEYEAGGFGERNGAADDGGGSPEATVVAARCGAAGGGVASGRGERAASDTALRRCLAHARSAQLAGRPARARRRPRSGEARTRPDADAERARPERPQGARGRAHCRAAAEGELVALARIAACADG